MVDWSAFFRFELLVEAAIFLDAGMVVVVVVVVGFGGVADIGAYDGDLVDGGEKDEEEEEEEKADFGPKRADAREDG